MPDRSLIAVAAAFGAGGLLLAAALLDLDLPDVLALGVAAAAYGCGAYAEPRAGAAGALGLFAALAAGGGGVVPVVLCTAGPWIAGRILR